MRFHLLAHIFLLASLALYSKAPWHQANLGASEKTPHEVTVESAQRSVAAPQFQPPRLQPDRWNSCSVCLTGETPTPSFSSKPTPRWSGMEWQCQECDTVHIGRTAYSR